MKNLLLLFFGMLLTIETVQAQSNADSVPVRQDSTAPHRSPRRNSAPVKLPQAAPHRRDSTAAFGTGRLPADSAVYYPLHQVLSFEEVLKNHPYFVFFGPRLQINMDRRKVPHQELLFFVLLGLTFYYALIHASFGKYIQGLVVLFLRISMRQQQLREIVYQTQLPAFLLNLFFVMTGGLYLALLSENYQWTGIHNTWILWLYASTLLLLIYTGKYFILKLTGWIFRVQSATNTYISVVFMVNKILGICLLPVLWLLAFPHPVLAQIVRILSIIFVFCLFGYRFLISYRPVRNEIKLNPFHFFLYLCAFEIAPLLLVYKVLLRAVDSSF